MQNAPERTVQARTCSDSRGTRVTAKSFNRGSTVPTRVVMTFAAGDFNTIARLLWEEGMRPAVGGGSALAQG